MRRVSIRVVPKNSLLYRGSPDKEPGRTPEGAAGEPLQLLSLS
jgi:hypothetical protein